MEGMPPRVLKAMEGMPPHALKGQKLLAQGNTLGYKQLYPCAL